MLAVNNNRQNFTAHLDLTNIKLNKKRWNNISKMFEEKTQKTPYTFELSDSNRQLDIYAFPEDFDDVEHSCTLTKEATTKLLEASDEKVMQKLIKLLNIFNHQDTTRKTAIEFLNKLEKDDKYGTLTFPYYKNGDSIYDRIFFPVIDKMKADRMAATERDTIFKDAQFID